MHERLKHLDSKHKKELQKNVYKNLQVIGISRLSFISYLFSMKRKHACGFHLTHLFGVFELFMAFFNIIDFCQKVIIKHLSFLSRDLNGHLAQLSQQKVCKQKQITLIFRVSVFNVGGRSVEFQKI